MFSTRQTARPNRHARLSEYLRLRDEIALLLHKNRPRAIDLFWETRNRFFAENWTVNDFPPVESKAQLLDLTDFFKKNQEVLAESRHGVKPVETGRRAPCHSSFKKENPVAQESHSRKRRQKKQAEVFFLVLLIIITAVLMIVFT
jgi:hypothetical protein